jgi:hypothetical protein
MRLTQQILFDTAKKIGVEIEVIEHPGLLMTDFFIFGDPKKRKEMIDFIENFRYVGFVFNYIEKTAINWAEIDGIKRGGW